MASPKNTPMHSPGNKSGPGGGLLLGYSVLCYAVGVVGQLGLVLACMGVLPLGGGPVRIESNAGAIAFDLGWVLLFGAQHILMSRPGFKRAWRARLPLASERPTFTLLAGAIMAGAIWTWQPVPGVLWSVDGTAAVFLRMVAGLGWAYLLFASFAINHLELFGVQQAWQHLRGQEITSPVFERRWMYRFDRHPIMTGMLIGLWVTPHMSMGQLVLATGLSLYMAVGVTLEERELLRVHGDGYREYMREVGTLVPRFGPRG